MTNPTIDSLWQGVCQLLRQRLNSDVFARWIAVISPNRITGNVLVLNVGNNFYQSWLEENYLSLIQEAVNATCGQEMKVSFEVLAPPAEAQEKVPPPQAKPAATRKAAKPQPASNLNPKYVFDTFVIGASNRFAHASSLAVAQAPGKAYNPLFIYGGSGLGKTHLMQAVGHFALQKSTARVNYLSCEALMNDFVDALSSKSIKQFRDKYRNADLLLIDDIHFLARTGQLQEEFFHTFNQLFNAHKQIVMTSDRPPAEINGLEQRLVSRFEWGMVNELTPPDLETRIAILRCKQQGMKVTLSDDVINFIASNIKANIRRLEGALIRLVSYSSLYNRPITVELADQLLQDSIEQERKNPVSIPMIQKNTADFFDIRLADMTSAHRDQNIALPRQIAMYLCRKFTNASLPEIGTAFGKTHATVLYACRQIEKRASRDRQLRQTIGKLSRMMDKNVDKPDEKIFSR